MGRLSIQLAQLQENHVFVASAVDQRPGYARGHVHDGGSAAQPCEQPGTRAGKACYLGTAHDGYGDPYASHEWHEPGTAYHCDQEAYAVEKRTWDATGTPAQVPPARRHRPVPFDP